MICKYCNKNGNAVFYLGGSPLSKYKTGEIIVCESHFYELCSKIVPEYIPEEQRYTYIYKYYEKFIKSSK